MYQIRQYESGDTRKEVNTSSVNGIIDECREKWLIHLSRIGNDGLPHFVTSQGTHIQSCSPYGGHSQEEDGCESCRRLEPNPWKAVDE